ncbi:hypothetical protein QQ045_010186 [Rhodiola kirilowii]
MARKTATKDGHPPPPQPPPRQPKKPIPKSVDYLLFIVKDVSVNPNPDKVADIKYVNKEQLKELLLRKADAGEEGLKLSPWFRLVVDNFLYKWWDHVEKGTLHEAACRHENNSQTLNTQLLQLPRLPQSTLILIYLMILKASEYYAVTKYE